MVNSCTHSQKICNMIFVSRTSRERALRAPAHSVREADATPSHAMRERDRMPAPPLSELGAEWWACASLVPTYIVRVRRLARSRLSTLSSRLSRARSCCRRPRAGGLRGAARRPTASAARAPSAERPAIGAASCGHGPTCEPSRPPKARRREFCARLRRNAENGCGSDRRRTTRPGAR